MLRSFIVLCAWLSQICSKQRHPRPHSFDIHQFPICCKGWCPISDVGLVWFNRVMRRKFSSSVSGACFCADCGGYRNWYETCCSHPRSSETMEDRVRGIVSIKPVVGSLQIYVRS